jgi:hypothetical protein
MDQFQSNQFSTEDEQALEEELEALMTESQQANNPHLPVAPSKPISPSLSSLVSQNQPEEKNRKEILLS